MGAETFGGPVGPRLNGAGDCDVGSSTPVGRSGAFLKQEVSIESKMSSEIRMRK